LLTEQYYLTGSDSTDFPKYDIKVATEGAFGIV